MRGDSVRGGRTVDGDATTAAEVTLLASGSPTTAARTLGDDEFLNITNVHVESEVGGDLLLQATGDAPTVDATIAAKGSIEITFLVPWTCPKGAVPKFTGIVTGKDSCILTGFITGA